MDTTTPSASQLREAFAKFDADNDGALAWKEWHRLVAAARARRRHDARKALTYHPKADDGGALAQFAKDGGDAAAIERADEAAAWALRCHRSLPAACRATHPRYAACTFVAKRSSAPNEMRSSVRTYQSVGKGGWAAPPCLVRIWVQGQC